MNDIPYINWYAESDKALAESIGSYIQYHRLNQNRTQAEVSLSAGISRSTLSLLERGETVTLNSLLRVLRVLNLLTVMDTFRVEEEIGPLAYAKLKKKERKRARRSDGPSPDKEGSGW